MAMKGKYVPTLQKECGNTVCISKITLLFVQSRFCSVAYFATPRPIFLLYRAERNVLQVFSNQIRIHYPHAAKKETLLLKYTFFLQWNYGVIDLLLREFFLHVSLLKICNHSSPCEIRIPESRIHGFSFCRQGSCR